MRGRERWDFERHWMLFGLPHGDSIQPASRLPGASQPTAQGIGIRWGRVARGPEHPSALSPSKLFGSDATWCVIYSWPPANQYYGFFRR